MRGLGGEQNWAHDVKPPKSQYSRHFLKTKSKEEEEEGGLWKEDDSCVHLSTTDICLVPPVTYKSQCAETGFNLEAMLYSESLG